MLSQRVKIDGNGRIVIPAALRKVLNIDIGEDLIISIKDDSINISSKKKALSRLREKAQKLKKPGQNMVDEFLKFRKEDSGDL